MKKANKNHHKPNIFLVVLGGFLVFIGIIGLVLPFLQGILFMIAGFAILSTQLPSVKRRVNKFKSWIGNKKKAF